MDEGVHFSPASSTCLAARTVSLRLFIDKPVIEPRLLWPVIQTCIVIDGSELCLCVCELEVRD